MSPQSIVLFGETGVGKSSIINLMAGKQLALTSSDSDSCTRHWTEHSITLDGYAFRVFDTVGLLDYHTDPAEFLDAIENAYDLINKLLGEGGIHLLLFCVRAGRVRGINQSHFRIFYEWLCEGKVPVILVVTGLDRERAIDWWGRNSHAFIENDIRVLDHVCITGNDALKTDRVYPESRRWISDVVIKHTHSRQAVVRKGEEGHYSRYLHRLMKLFLEGHRPQKDAVTVLTKRCKIPRDAAIELVERIDKKH